MFEAEENNSFEDESGGGQPSNSQLSSVLHEAVKAMAESDGFRAFARIASTAIMVLDGDNLPPQIEGADKGNSSNDQKAGSKARDKAQSPNIRDANSDQETRDILINAYSILDKHHRSPHDSSIVPAQAPVVKNVYNDVTLAGTGGQAPEQQSRSVGDVGQSSSTAKAGQNQEANILENAYSILGKHHRSLDLSVRHGQALPGNGTQSVTGAEKQTPSQNDQTSVNNALETEKARKAEQAQVELTRQEQVAREAQAAREMQARAQELRAETARRARAELDKGIKPEDLPATITDADDAKKFIEYARQDNKKVIMDFSTQGCGWCNKMENETYPQIDKSEFVVMHIDVGNLQGGVGEFKSAMGISGRHSGYPYTAVFGPSNDYRAAQKTQEGYMDAGDLLNLIGTVH